MSNTNSNISSDCYTRSIGSFDRIVQLPTGKIVGKYYIRWVPSFDNWQRLCLKYLVSKSQFSPGCIILGDIETHIWYTFIAICLCYINDRYYIVIAFESSVTQSHLIYMWTSSCVIIWNSNIESIRCGIIPKDRITCGPCSILT